MWITILIFAIAAVVGLTMALAVFEGRLPPIASAVVHGALAATGLVLLIVAVCAHRATGPARWALGFFLVAALGGLDRKSTRLNSSHDQISYAVFCLKKKKKKKNSRTTHKDTVSYGQQSKHQATINAT